MKSHLARLYPVRPVFTLAFALFFLLPLCKASAAQPLKVAVSIAPQAWLVDRIGGDLVAVETLIPAGSDPHTYEPKPSQVTTLSKADLYLTIGTGFEKAWLPRLSSITPSMPTVPMDAGVERIAMVAHEHAHGHDGHGHDHAMEAEHGHGHDVAHHPATDGRSHGEYDDHEKLKAEDRQWEDRRGTPDPHIWTEPANMLVMAKNTFEALQQADKAHSETYLKNYFAVRRDIERLERELMQQFAAEAGKGRAFMVFHPAWGYFARAHALTQVPIEVEGKEPSPRELAAIVNEAREMNVGAIFVQPQMSRRAADVVAAEIRAQVIEADPLAYDWANNLRRVALEFKAALR